MHRPNGTPAGRLWRERQSWQLEMLPGLGIGTSSHQVGICLCSGLSELCTGDVNISLLSKYAFAGSSCDSHANWGENGRGFLAGHYNL